MDEVVPDAGAETEADPFGCEPGGEDVFNEGDSMAAGPEDLLTSGPTGEDFGFALPKELERGLSDAGVGVSGGDEGGRGAEGGHHHRGRIECYPPTYIYFPMSKIPTAVYREYAQQRSQEACCQKETLPPSPALPH